MYFWKSNFFSKMSPQDNTGVYQYPTGCEPRIFSIASAVSTAELHFWNLTSNNVYLYQQFHCCKTWLSHFRRARWFVFDDTRGLYQSAVNWIQHTFRTSRVLLSNSLGTPDFPKLLAIWISHGPWNRKFSAPSSPWNKFENRVVRVPYTTKVPYLQVP